MTKHKLKIRTVYQPLFTNLNKRYVIVTGGRNSAKSFSVAMAEAKALTSDKYIHKTLYTRYTLTSAEISIIPEFQHKLEITGIAPDYHTSGNTITNTKTGAQIIFSGIKTSSGNQTAKLKSIPGLSRFVIEEGEEFKDDVAFDTIDLSVRNMNAPNRVTIVMNPQDIDHFIWERWFADSCKYVEIDGAQIPISTHPDVYHIHTTYLDNLKNIPPDYLQQIYHLRDTNRKKYEHLFLGKWQERAEGVVFENWEVGEFDTSLPYGYGLDFGYFPDPLALVKCAVDSMRKIVYLHEEIYQTQLSTAETVARVKAITSDRLVVADTSEPRLIAELGANGVNIDKATKGPDSVIDGIKRMQDYKLVITHSSNNLRKELSTYVWNDKKKSIPIDSNNHCFIGSTLIETSEGLVRMDKIKPGMLVKTTGGYNTVLKKWYNGRRLVNKYLIQLDTFSLSLVCTKDHLIKTDLGWIQMSELKSGMTVYLSRSSMEKYTGYTLGKGIFQGDAKECTLQYGNTITERPRKAFTFITRTKIPGTTALKTLNVSSQVSTFQIMPKEGLRKILIGLANFIPKALQRLLNGIEAKTAESGILNMLKTFGRIGNISHDLALNAARSSKQNTSARINFVQITASQQTEGKQTLTTNKGDARSAIQNLPFQNILECNVVGVHVVEGSEEKVYDLSIQNEHEYFANGVLVHNCVDSARYIFDRLSEGSAVSAWA